MSVRLSKNSAYLGCCKKNVFRSFSLEQLTDRHLLG